MAFTSTYLEERQSILRQVDFAEFERTATGLAAVRDSGGRLFTLAVGGSAGHAANDFRKLCPFEAYAPTGNVSELTARISRVGPVK